MEKELIKKVFYKTLMEQGETAHPVEVMGLAFFEEHKKAVSDLSSIRFAQGEVYFHSKDYEASINKWEAVNGDLEPWAKKNIGDAYYELEWYLEAEKKYRSVNTNNKTLLLEVTLQLISLYREREMTEQVYQSLKKAIALDPDYRDVLDIARLFYEEQQDWENLIELVVKEMNRTKENHWCSVLNSCIEKRFNIQFPPNYFTEVLHNWYEVDETGCIKIISKLMESYEGTKYYLEMVSISNEFFEKVGLIKRETREKAMEIHENCYKQLMSGTYLVNEIKTLIPNLLVNWLKIQENDVLPSAALLAWNECFPSEVESTFLQLAERNLYQYEHKAIPTEESKVLLESLFSWAKLKKLEIGNKLYWSSSKLKNKGKHLLITGFSGSGAASVVNSILGENVLSDEKCPAYITYSDEIEMVEITKSGRKRISDINSLDTSTMVDLKWKSNYLAKMNNSLIYIPEFKDETTVTNDEWQQLCIADGILFVLDAYHNITEDEMKMLVKIHEQAANVPMYFVVNKIDSAFSEIEANRMVETTEIKLREIFANTRVYPYSSLNIQKVQGLVDFVQTNFNYKHKVSDRERTSKVLHFIRNTIAELINARILKGNSLSDQVTYKEDVLQKLKGLISQLEETVLEQTDTITDQYNVIKMEKNTEVEEKIHKLIRECTETITEESDFKSIQSDLNRVMNDNIRRYFEEESIPSFRYSLQEWLRSIKEDLSTVQGHLHEMGETFNSLLGSKKKIELKCDFQILNDWQRDLNRMLSRIEVEEENIIDGAKPSQLLLKSAGVILGALKQNNGMLCNQYKRLIENGDYKQISTTIVKKSFHEFDLFERSLKTDLAIFFERPVQELLEQLETLEHEINETKDTLANMNEKPELFYDPIKLFEISLLQNEMITNSNAAEVVSSGLSERTK